MEFFAAEPGASQRNLWAIVDCARDERVYSLLDLSYQDKCCLYSGNLPIVLERAAPHLVQVTPDDRFMWKLIDLGWGNGWNIFFRSESSLAGLRNHFRRIAIVRDEYLRRLVFRYYDPRVLRVYLPTCVSKELAAVFGPVKRFYMEGETGDQMRIFSLAKGELETETKFVGRPGKPESPPVGLSAPA